MKWTFAKNEGGRESGFHEPGVETFMGNFDRYLARELIQNSLDARHDLNKPVQVVFDLDKLDRKDIPDITGLKAAFERCGEYFPKQKNAVAFFERAVALASKSKITALRVGDYNTSGVIGTDEQRDKNWYNLIRCAGSSSKSGNEGGSFGIGKNAPFAASQMRTVLYSTYNEDKQHVFQGVATLVSHQLPGGKGVAQPVGYLGGKQGESLRVKSEIPPKFLRTKMGTDIIVLGFPEFATWKKDLMQSVVENFWPAIDWNDLVVTVGGEKISRENLPELMQRFSAAGGDEFIAHHYYNAYKNASMDFHKKLPKLRDVSMYLSSGDNELPKRVAMVRKTGMVIFYKPARSIVPFCGVFVCRNDVGNKLLREMEPPRHDVWDANHPEKGANKPIESEYVNFIRDCIRDLAPSDDSKVISVPDLNRFLPDDDDSPEESFDGADEQHKAESTDRSPLPEKIVGKKIDPRRKALQPDENRPGDGDDETGGADGDGKGATGAGQGDGEQAGGKGSDAKSATQHGEQSKPSIPIRYRTFTTNLSAGVYVVTVQSMDKAAKNANLVVWTVGDDQRIAAEIRSARLRDGQELQVKAPGILGPVALPNSKGTLHVEVRLAEPLRVAMEVAAHEAD